MKIRFKKLNQAGFDHTLLAVIFVVLFAIAGVAYLVYTRAATAPAPILGIADKCLDNYANLKRDNNKIILWTCNNTDAQKWLVKNNGTIVNANGYCLTAANAKSGSRVTLSGCGNATSQTWSYNSSNQTIIHAASKLCLDDYARLTKDGNPIQLYTCNGTVAQVWKPQAIEEANPTISAFTADPATFNVGSTTKLSWTTTNTKSCSVTPGGPADTTATSWTTPAQTTSGTKTFTLTCKNADGATTTKSASVIVNTATTPPPTTGTGFDVGSSYGGNADPSPLETSWGVKLEARRTYFTATQQSSAVNTIKADIAAGRKTSSISFKLPASWADMAAGKQDAWAKSLSDTLAAANVSGHTIRIAFHHEPENDAAPNDGSTVAGRDAWKNMQARLSTFYDRPGFQYVAILMGYHTFYGSTTMKQLWSLDASIPTNAKVKGVGFDIYQQYGVDGSTKWTDMNAYFTQIGTWAKARNMAWGLSETGLSAAAFTQRPTYFTDTVAQMKAQGGSWLEYFNSDLNSPDPKWSFTATEGRSTAFDKLLTAERAN